MSSTKFLQLGEVATFIRGINFKPDDVAPLGTPGTVGCMRTKNVQESLDLTDVWAVPKEFVRREEQILKEGDLLVSSANSWNLVGKCSWVPRLPYEASFGGFVSVLRANTTIINARYLYYWFTSKRTQETVRSFGQKTTNISNLNTDRCLKLEIPIPSMKEQERIVSLLDQTSLLQEKRRQAIEKINSLSQAIFLEMFGDPVKNEKGWTSLKLNNLTRKIGSGSTPKGGDASYKDSGISLIRSLNVHDKEFKFKDLAFIDDEQANKLKNVIVEPNDVLLNITGASVARVCIVPNQVLPARVNQHVAIIRPTEKLNSLFLETLFVCPPFKNHLLRIGGAGATREALTKEQLESLDIIVPDIKTQNHFVKRVEALNKILSLNKTQDLKIEEMFCSLQDKYFVTSKQEK